MTLAPRALKLSALAIATMIAVAGPQAIDQAHAGGKPKVHFGIHIGGGQFDPYFHGGYYPYYGYRNPCFWLKRKWYKTGKLKWRWRYRRCMRRHFFW